MERLKGLCFRVQLYRVEKASVVYVEFCRAAATIGITYITVFLKRRISQQ